MCCECGTVIEPNPANMCVGCLRSHVDITEGIPKQVALQFCKGCERFSDILQKYHVSDVTSDLLKAIFV